MKTIDRINVYADLETEAVQKALVQFNEFLDGQENIVKAVLLPDCHFGYGVPIGSVFASKGIVYPAAVGYDIGCGMCAVPTSFTRKDIEENQKRIFDAIYTVIPVGHNHNVEDTPWHANVLLNRSSMADEKFNNNGLKQLASLGGGNHFIELGYDRTDVVWIIIHSGSRGIGHNIAEHYIKLASGDGKAREGSFGFDVNSDDGKNYIMDLAFMLEFALQNRCEMIKRIDVLLRCELGINGNIRLVDLINRNHNHAELKDDLWIHRKGATHAEAGMLGVIPGNMRDGSFIVRGKGNPESLYSSSHGAGRILGRKAAERSLNVEDFKKSMEGIQARVQTSMLDESPAAYKNIFEVMELQKDLVDIIAYVKPLVNIKG